MGLRASPGAIAGWRACPVCTVGGTPGGVRFPELPDPAVGGLRVCGEILLLRRHGLACPGLSRTGVSGTVCSCGTGPRCPRTGETPQTARFSRLTEVCTETIGGPRPTRPRQPPRNRPATCPSNVRSRARAPAPQERHNACPSRAAGPSVPACAITSDVASATLPQPRCLSHIASTGIGSADITSPAEPSTPEDPAQRIFGGSGSLGNAVASNNLSLGSPVTQSDAEPVRLPAAGAFTCGRQRWRAGSPS